MTKIYKRLSKERKEYFTEIFRYSKNMIDTFDFIRTSCNFRLVHRTAPCYEGTGRKKFSALVEHIVYLDSLDEPDTVAIIFRDENETGNKAYVKIPTSIFEAWYDGLLNRVQLTSPKTYEQLRRIAQSVHGKAEIYIEANEDADKVAKINTFVPTKGPVTEERTSPGDEVVTVYKHPLCCEFFDKYLTITPGTTMPTDVGAGAWCIVREIRSDGTVVTINGHVLTPTESLNEDFIRNYLTSLNPTLQYYVLAIDSKNPQPNQAPKNRPRYTFYLGQRPIAPTMQRLF